MVPQTRRGRCTRYTWTDHPDELTPTFAHSDSDPASPSGVGPHSPRSRSGTLGASAAAGVPLDPAELLLDHPDGAGPAGPLRHQYFAVRQRRFHSAPLHLPERPPPVLEPPAGPPARRVTAALRDALHLLRHL